MATPADGKTPQILEREIGDLSLGADFHAANRHTHDKQL